MYALILYPDAALNAPPQGDITESEGKRHGRVSSMGIVFPPAMPVPHRNCLEKRDYSTKFLVLSIFGCQHHATLFPHLPCNARGLLSGEEGRKDISDSLGCLFPDVRFAYRTKRFDKERPSQSFTLWVGRHC